MKVNNRRRAKMSRKASAILALCVVQLLKSRKNFLINFGGLKHTIFITSPLARSICKRIQICECVKVTVIMAYLRKLRRFCKWDTFRQERGRAR